MLYKLKRPFTHKQLDPFRFVDNSIHIHTYVQRRHTIHIVHTYYATHNTCSEVQTKHTFTIHITFDPESNEQQQNREQVKEENVNKKSERALASHNKNTIIHKR